MSEQITMRTRARILVARETFPFDPRIARQVGTVESIILSLIIWRQGWSEHWVEFTQAEIEHLTGIKPRIQSKHVEWLKAQKLLKTKRDRLRYKTWYLVTDADLANIDQEIAKDYEAEAQERANEPQEEVSENPNDFPNYQNGSYVKAPSPEKGQNEGKTPMISLTTKSVVTSAGASEPLVVAVPGACTEIKERTRKGVQGKTLETESEYRPDGLTDSEDSESDSSPENLEASEREETDSENESDSATEIPPEKSAPQPPPADGARRTPRMPPPRPQAPESPRTRREADRLLGPTDDGKTPPPKPQKQGDVVKAADVTTATVMEEWNRIARENGLPTVVTSGTEKAGRLMKKISARLKSPYWVANWRAGLKQVPKAAWRVGEKGYFATIDYFIQVGRVEELVAEAERMQRSATAQPPPTDARSSKCPHPPGSPEWEKWYLANG